MGSLSDRFRRLAGLFSSRKGKDADCGTGNEEFLASDIHAASTMSSTPLDSLVTATDAYDSFDFTPWKHPFLSKDNLNAFRDYGDKVHAAIKTWYMDNRPNSISIGLLNNMAQNLYNWGRMLSNQGSQVALFVDPQDQSAQSCPQWEDFNGEWEDIFDGSGFLRHHNTPTKIEVIRPHLDDEGLLAALQSFAEGNRQPFIELTRTTPSVRLTELAMFGQCSPLTGLARQLTRYDVLCAQSSPIAAYFSGRPYVALYVGGDLQIDCGRGDWYGRLMHLSFASSRFILVGGPDGVAYCRRLGLKNAIYFPTPIDTSRYCPGDGAARVDWQKRTRKDIFVLTTARIDSGVKGNGAEIIDALEQVALEYPRVCFVFLKWGEDRESLARRIANSRTTSSFHLLSPVGKERLIDYYRSADIVLDQFVYGYYGMTGFETAAVGKPILIHLRKEHYSPLYAGDIMPANSTSSLPELVMQLKSLLDSSAYRKSQGAKMRAWSLRNHNNVENVKKLQRLMTFVAMNGALPQIDIVNPLELPYTSAELQYHEKCRAHR